MGNPRLFKNKDEKDNQITGGPIKSDAMWTMMKQLRLRISRLVKTNEIRDTKEKEKLEYLLVTKKWNPYCLRHSSISWDSDYLPEYALKKKVRWSINSRQGARYIKNRMGNELKNRILEHNGIIIEETQKKKPSVLNCYRCDLMNIPENNYCSKCSYPLKPEAFDEVKEEENKKITQLEDKYREMDSILQTLLKAFTSVDEPGKQVIAKQLIESGRFN